MSESNDGQEEASIDQNELAQFKKDVVRFLQLPELIKETEEPAKQLKAELKELEKSLQLFMKQNDINQCTIPENIGGGVLVIKPSTTREPAKKEHMKKGMESFLKKRNIEATYEEIEKEINNQREIVTKNGLKRVKK